jgi:NAD(P)-dependent dehydrogenase (short-subunit alcohol dehydrogenase family)
MSNSSKPVAYITGVSRGIGRLLATALAEDGALTVGFARASEDLDSLRDQPTPIVPISMDVTDPASVAAGFSQAVETVGPPSLVVTCAGSIGALGPIATVDPERWWDAVAVDLRGTMVCAQASIQLMLEQGAGRIVTVYGNLGDDGREHVSAFAAAKSGVARFTETLATELAGTGVLAICIHPGFVRTPMTESLAFTEEGREWLPAFGERAPDHWGDGAEAVDLVRRISAGHADALGGRVVQIDDDLQSLTRACESDTDHHHLRLRH